MGNSQIMKGEKRDLSNELTSRTDAIFFEKSSVNVGENTRLESLSEGVFLGMGNPLLDIQVQVDKELLERYGLKENDAILAGDEHIPLFEEITKRDGVKFIPGGATQNTLRVFQWIVKEPRRSVFFGAVGKDQYSEKLSEEVSKAGVDARYQVNQEVKTGTCAALIYRHQRSLCAHLGAANTFTIAHLENSLNESFIAKASYFYISGFFLTVCPPAVQKVAEHAASKNKYFMMNLAAPFISTLFSTPLNDALPYVDILFANKEEIEAYSEANKFGTSDIREIARRLVHIEKVNKKRPRTVIVTQGPDPIIVVRDGGMEKEFVVEHVENIVDTNGAGDAFCGGFIAELISGSRLEDCIRCGCYAASIIIQQEGCTFPENPHNENKMLSC
jgi:adenosine kinase